MSSTEEDSVPVLPEDSPGSSVSSTLQDEYQQLLKYAVITPSFDPGQLPQTLAEATRSFREQKDQLIFQDSSVTESSEDSAARIETMHELRESAGRVTAPEMPRRQPPVHMTPMSSHPDADRIPETPATPDESSLEDDESVETTVESPVVDGDIARMEGQLDNWCLDLKRNVLAEFTQAKIALVERHRQHLQAEKERHAKEKHKLLNEIESLKELLNTYEQSIERKDQVISNLTHALQKQRERFEMLKKFNSWKLRYSDDKREAFASCLARKHYHHKIMSKVWDGWHSIIEAKWRHRVEKACQSKAQEVCMTLTNDYEAKLASLNEALESSRNEVQRLHAERDHYEETMKKAFMRGVCALNLEAMSMFHEKDDASTSEQAEQIQFDSPSVPLQAPPMPVSNGFPQQPHAQPSTAMPAGPRTVTSQDGVTASTLTQTVTRTTTRRVGPSRTTTSAQKAPKTITAKVTARPDTMRTGQASLSGVGLAPPMSSVLVERHHPVTQQTMGHAIASHYPRQQVGGPSSGGTGSSIAQRKIAGQTGGKVPLASPNIMTVKVVQ
ncbi:centrosomal protein POC5-like isoform X2 [Ptychodera flava]|uniref:centrosomal protein POC5-like isoform X2 n=1 Tax=Ptychodera flava TaxID=63121 RepID=UPI003969F457